ncbi:MAG TPA: hypothetical protein VFK88_03380 [Gallionella sp.]|nr:hypothetical protein [Gallionella sp.]
MIKSRSMVALILSILQALCVFVVWWYESHKDISLMPTSIWILTAWSWVAWPVFFLAIKKYSFFVVSCIVGSVFILPAATTIWFATSVYVFGFAP